MSTKVHATIGKNQAALLKNHDPVTALQAKYSLEFAVASALVAGNVGLTQLDDGFVNRPDIKETMKKVSFTAIDSVCDIEPAFAVSDRIVIDLADGRRLDSGEVRFARGHALKPMVDGRHGTQIHGLLRGDSLRATEAVARAAAIV